MIKELTVRGTLAYGGQGWGARKNESHSPPRHLIAKAGAHRRWSRTSSVAHRARCTPRAQGRVESVKVASVLELAAAKATPTYRAMEYIQGPHISSAVSFSVPWIEDRSRAVLSLSAQK